MKTIGKLLDRIARGQRGATSIEYALIASLISIVIFGSALAVGVEVTELYDKVAGAFD
jgi:pilus assembly protein Flp/PilA